MEGDVCKNTEVNANGLNLFSHSLPPFTLGQKISFFLTGIVLVPLRLVASVSVMLVTWGLSGLGLAARDREAFQSHPATGWRGACREVMYTATSHVILWCLGFRLKIVGEPAAREQAPVVIAAPHTSFLDVFTISVCRGSPVARIENSRTPGMSAIQTLGHTIFVDRRSPESRQAALTDIVTRVSSPQPWPQVFIFSEGTTTNGSALIRFQTGGFRAGTPVQPVLIRYSHPHLTTWTRDQGHRFLQSMLLLLATPWKTVTVTFLPVHQPSKEEQEDPILYAKSVQEVMALHLGVPATDIQRSEFVREPRDKKQ